jgi:hypothetical protein
MKLLVVGQGRHGKDEFCKVAEKFGFTFSSSSWFMAEKLVYPMIKERMGYKTLEECYEDRHNHRQLWYDIITEYNAENPSKLTKELLSKYDIYCGMRNPRELNACKDLFDLKIWIDAHERLGSTETSSSNNITKNDCDIIIENNGTLAEFREKCKNLMVILQHKHILEAM